MSATKAKLELSLDEIIKSNKKAGNRNNLRRSTGSGNAKGNLRKKGQGILKRKIGAQAKNRPLSTLKRRTSNRINNGVNVNNKPANGGAINKVATQRLVNKLVKKALKQVTVARTPIKIRSRAIRNVIRGRNVVRGRGGVRRGGTQSRALSSLNRVSQRSHVIGRRPRNNINLANNNSPVRRFGRGGGFRRGRGGVPQQQLQREPNPIISQLNYLRRQQQQSRQNVVGGGVRQMPMVPAVLHQRSIPVRRPAPPQQRTQIVYVQQPPRQRPVRRRQPPAQQIIYVQQAPRGRGRGGGGGRGRGAFRGGQRPQQQNNHPFYEPPNFLQRIPIIDEQPSSSYGRGGRGRGRRW